MNPKQRIILIVSILASIVVFVDGSIASVAMPAIVREMGGGLSLQQWINDAYLITLGTLILAAGSLSDIFGRKRILLYGLGGFLVTSLLCALSPDGIFLIVARALQGVAGALIVPSSLAIIISVFSGTAQAKAIGQWTAWTGISFILGPLLGGLLVDLASWRLAFAINVVPILLAMYLLSRVTLDEKTTARARVDIPGIYLGALGLGALVFGLIEQPHFGWGSPVIHASLIAGVALLVAFVLHERKAKAPMVPLSLFRVRNFSVGNLATLFIYAALSLQGFVLVIFLQQVAHFPATLAGLASVPVAVIMFVLAPRFGARASKLGPRLFMGIGPLVAAGGTLLLLMVGSPTDYWTQVLPGILVFGFGLSMIVAPLTSAVLSAIKQESAGIGSAINNAVSRISGLVAVASVGFIAGDSLNLAGFHASMVVCAVLLAIGGVISLIGIVNIKRNAPDASVVTS